MSGDIEFESIVEGNITTPSTVKVYGASWVAEEFSPLTTHLISYIMLKISATGNPHDLMVLLTNVDSNKKPLSYAITSVIVHQGSIPASADWVMVTLPEDILVTAGTGYAIVLQALNGDASNYVSWVDGILTTTYLEETGLPWVTIAGRGLLFQVWGAPYTTVSPEHKQENQMISTTALGYWSTEALVYQATGMSSNVVQKMGNLSPIAVTNLIQGYIQTSDQRIRHLMGIPYTVRKEFHVFHFNEQFREFGPWEDEYEFFDYYDPRDRVEKVFAIYSNKRRMKYPFPKNCDDLTEDTTVISSESGIDGMQWNVDDVPHNPTPTTTLTKDITDFMAGTASLKCVVANSTGGMIIFPKTKNLAKAQYPWDYIAFWMKTSNPNAVFTFHMYDVLGRHVTQTFWCGNNDFNKTLVFNPALANTWQIVALKFMIMQGYAGGANWVFVPVQYFTIEVDRACTFWIDNLNWNDGIFFTAPKGLLCWSRSEISAIADELEVTYSFDPFKQEVPVDISLGSAKMAGILLLEYLIGIRQRATAFTQSSDNLQAFPDKETLEFTKARLEREIESFLGGIGFKTYSGVGVEG